MDRIEIKDGFLHEKLIVVPRRIVDNNLKNKVLEALYITDIGYFPNAKNHFRERVGGSSNHIFICCFDGKGAIELEGQSYQLSRNQFCIIPAGVDHKYYADMATPWSIYWLHFNGSNSAAYIEYLVKETFVMTLNTLQFAQFIHQFNRCYTMLEKGYSKETMMILGHELALLFLKMYSESEEVISPNRNPGIVDQCIGHMLTNIYEKISLMDLTVATNMSRSHLIHLFKEQTGYTPIDYFIHLKIQKACHLIDTTNLSIKEIAYQIGYDDPQYFSRIFKSVMGSSPKFYRTIEKG